MSTKAWFKHCQGHLQRHPHPVWLHHGNVIAYLDEVEVEQWVNEARRLEKNVDDYVAGKLRANGIKIL